jgi:hypothetical protein
MTPYYQDDSVTLFHGKAEDVLPSLEPVDHIITDPPYSEHTHKSVRSAKMKADDRGGKYGSDVRRNVDLGFDHLTPELRAFCASEFSRIARRWSLVFSDVESDHLWRDDLTAAGLDYVRTGAWHKVGSAPQFSGDRPATAFETITICHPPGRKRWNGGGAHAWWSVPIVLRAIAATVEPSVPDPAKASRMVSLGSVNWSTSARNRGDCTRHRNLSKAVLIEQNELHCEVTAKRLQNAGDTLFGGVA